MTSVLEKYADLLVNYCLEIKTGDKLFIQTTMLAEPLVREVYRAAWRAGAGVVETDFMFRERNRIFLAEVNEAQARTISPFYQMAMENFDAYLHIRAPFNLREDQNISDTEGSKSRWRSEALRAVSNTYFRRTAKRGESDSLKRTLCQYPTDAAAQEAGMSLSEYEHFVFNACKLFEDNPREAWLALREQQKGIVEYLNNCKSIRYVGASTDISFSTIGRTWINSDGQTNMPSGEVYTSPVENSVNGVVHFSFPSIYNGIEVEDVRLWVKEGFIEKWEARRGVEFLDKIFKIEGTRRFGEAAIGTNYAINRMTKNILFDEKIGGTIHMAIGQSYLQTGGKNESAVHWDMITDMTEGGEIYADGALIYRNGSFLI
ncbi:MAG: aminopeptidase [Saprospiraceae bacterium]|nr:aminopeptidase [Saprospiraceae bacterium]